MLLSGRKSTSSGPGLVSAPRTGLGLRPFRGDSASVGRGTLAASVTSPVSADTLRCTSVGASIASSYCGLGSRDCDGLRPTVGFRVGRSWSNLRVYGEWRYHPLPCTKSYRRSPGGDHTSPLGVASSSPSDSSDRNPECCDGRPKTGEGRGLLLFSKSSRDASSEGWSSNTWSNSSSIMDGVAHGTREDSKTSEIAAIARRRVRTCGRNAHCRGGIGRVSKGLGGV